MVVVVVALMVVSVVKRTIPPSHVYNNLQAQITQASKCFATLALFLTI